MREYPNELRADFQQFYGLNLDDLGKTYSFNHASILAIQLPRESRVAKKLVPENEWSITDYLLANIEYWVHANVWAKTKDVKTGRNKPELIKPNVKKKAKPRIIDFSIVKEKLNKPRKEVKRGK